MAKKPKTITELEPGTNDWLKAWDQLTPQDQASIFNSQNSPAFNYNFDEAVTPGYAAPDPLGWGQIAGRDPLGLGQIGGAPTGLAGTQSQFQGMEMDPMYQQLVQSGGGVNIPQLSAKGALEPFDLQQAAAQVNLMQDNATSMADLIMAAMSGPGAIDPQAFAPVVTKPTERIATPGLDRLNQYSQGTGAKAYIARKIKAGATDDEAIADLFNFIDTPDSETVTEAERKTKQMIIDSMPSAFKTGQVVPPSGRGTGTGARTTQETRDLFNESALAQDAREMYEKAYEDQSKVDVGWEDPEHPGSYFTEAPVEEDSPAMQKFRNLGLPSPFESYTDPDRMNQMYQAMAPGREAEGEAWVGNVARTETDADRIAKETRGIDERNAVTQRLLRENPAGFAPGPTAPTSAGSGFRRSENNLAVGGGPLFGQAAPDRSFSMAPAPSTFQPAGRGIGGIVNPGGGFDFTAGENPQARALANAALNTNFGFGGGSRGTKTATLTPEAGKQSQKETDEARKRFIDANLARYQAHQALGTDQANSITAWENARHAALRGDTPLIDVMRQRKIGQRAQGVRA